METPIETVERLYTALDADDIATFVDLCADDVEVIYPADGTLPYGGRWQGRDGVSRFLDAHEAAEEILELRVARMAADGSHVFVYGHFRGRARETGRDWSTDFVHLMTVTSGRLVRWQALFDTAAALAGHASPAPRHDHRA